MSGKPGLDGSLDRSSENQNRSLDVSSKKKDLGQDAQATIHKRQGAFLPHWTREGGTYFVTFRLADSLPQSLIEAWLDERDAIVRRAKAEKRPLSRAEEGRLHRLHSEGVERYLDAGHGSCSLARDDVAAIVAGALRYFDRDRYHLYAWCVMPNHVHVVFRPLDEHSLPDILHSWKSYTAKKANLILGRRGEYWQQEYYDHIIRDEAGFVRNAQYTVNNPVAVGLENWRWVGSSFDTGRSLDVSSKNQNRSLDVSSKKKDLGQDAQATKADLGQDAQATKADVGQGVQATKADVGQDAQATKPDLGQDARATKADLGQDAQVTGLARAETR